MSDPAPAAAAPAPKKKSFGAKLVGVMLIIIGISLFLQILGPILGFGFNGATTSAQTVAVGSHNTGMALNQAHIGVREMFQEFLQILFNVFAFAALGMFLVFIFRKIVAAMKE